MSYFTEAKCVLVVPCYNEASRFHAESFATLLSSDDSTRFLFVNDGSADNTLQVLRQFAAEWAGRSSVLDLKPNRGKGEAVRQGMLHALAEIPGQYVGFWDADLATPLTAVPEFLDVLDRCPDIDMVFGSRIRLLGRHVVRNPMRHYAGRIFATTVSVSLGLPIYDTQCGAKIFRCTSQLRSVLSEAFESRWIFDVELLARFLAAWKHTGLHPEDKIYELPLQTWVDVAGSKLRSTDFVRSFTDLVKIRREFVRLQRSTNREGR